MKIYWLQPNTPQLAIVPRPRGDDWLSDDIAALRNAGIDVLVSALTPDEVGDLALASESDCCRRFDIEFISFPIEDRSVPASRLLFRETLDRLKALLAGGKTMAIHCRAGIGRSSMIAACLLVDAGSTVDGAFDAIQKARGCAVPDTSEQRQWVEWFCQGLPLGS